MVEKKVAMAKKNPVMQAAYDKLANYCKKVAIIAKIAACLLPKNSLGYCSRPLAEVLRGLVWPFFRRS
jgi:hypothetical protein